MNHLHQRKRRRKTENLQPMKRTVRIIQNVQKFYTPTLIILLLCFFLISEIK